MSLARLVLKAVSQTVPAHVRSRYAEEWSADLEGAEELELSQWIVVRGALATSFAIDRDHPAVTGMPVDVLCVRRIRWAAALLLTAFIIAATFIWFGATLTTTATSVAAVALAAAATGVAGYAIRSGITAFGARKVLLTCLVGFLPAVIFMGMSILPFIGIFWSGLALSVMLFLVAGGPRKQLPPRPLSAGRRVLLSLPFTVLTVAAAVLGILHTLVWNPLAKVPGHTLEEIYTALFVSGEVQRVDGFFIWGGFWALLAIAFPIFCSLRRFGGPRSTRRIIVVGSLLLAGTFYSQWLAAFPMGMGLADTFGISGGDATIPSTVLFMLGGPIATVTAVFAGLIPTRWRGPEVPRMQTASVTS